MTRVPIATDPVEVVALLGEPNRRRLYEFVSANRGAVGRDEAAAALGISRELAAFHLDRLAAGGLLEIEYRRRSGRSGPGAGRPAKLYRRAGREVAVSLPPRHYERAADVFADALDHLPDEVGPATARAVARARGMAAGVDARLEMGEHPDLEPTATTLLRLLREAGYEPEPDAATGTIRLRNCPYDSLAHSHRDLTCGMNLAWAEGVVEALADARLGVELAPEPGRCCVVFRPAAADPAGSPTPAEPAESPDPRSVDAHEHR